MAVSFLSWTCAALLFFRSLILTYIRIRFWHAPFSSFSSLSHGIGIYVFCRLPVLLSPPALSFLLTIPIVQSTYILKEVAFSLLESRIIIPFVWMLESPLSDIKFVFCKRVVAKWYLRVRTRMHTTFTAVLYPSLRCSLNVIFRLRKD